MRTARLLVGRCRSWALGASTAGLVVGSALLGQARDVDPLQAGYLTLLTALGARKRTRSGR